MAYLERASGARKTGTVVAVALIHGAAAVGLMSAFAGGMIQVLIHSSLPTHPITPIDPPTQEPTQKATTMPATEQRRADPTVPRPPIDFGDDLVIKIEPGTGSGIGPLPVDGRVDLGPVARPSPPVSFAPVAARPLGKPGLWVTNNDYPTGAMRRGEQGVTGFRLTVGPDGSVRDCVVTKSSGSSELDRATCAKLSARARFAPATDSSGSQVAGSYANAIRWEIPN